MASEQIKPITEVAAGLDIKPEHLIPYGYDKAKVRLEAREASGRPPGRLILVSAITPTDAGEGKTTTSIGLAQGFAKLGKRVCLALREPSLGPVFGMKGGATGGGKAILTPRVDINLHFNGDFHAITSANNLLAALIDNHLHHNNPLRIEQRRILWRRVIDLNDRALRSVVIGLGGPAEGLPRQGGFDITPASEVMATLCLSEDLEDLRKRLSRTLVALDRDRKPVTAADLKAVGAMMILLKDAIMPNLVQTGEGVPAFVHGGPFANIAHGLQLGDRHQDGDGPRRLDDHRSRLRLRSGRREVLRHQMLLRRPRNRRGGAGGHGARPQAPWWGAQEEAG